MMTANQNSLIVVTSSLKIFDESMGKSSGKLCSGSGIIVSTTPENFELL